MQTASPSPPLSDSYRGWWPLRRVRAVLRPLPAERYVHPKAAGINNAEAHHNANVDVAEDTSPNYLNWIADSCRPYLGQRVLEVGAGTGSVTARFADGREVHAVERDEWCIKEMERRFADNPNVSVRHADLVELAEYGERFDSVVMINVLEHIEDDVAALTLLRELLSPGGRVVLYVPALNGMYGKFDRRTGHYRRYAPWRMRRVLAAAGLREVAMRYMNMLSIPPWWIFSRGNVDRSPTGQLTLWDRTGIPIGRRLESAVRVPIGLNLLCVAEAKERP